MMSPHQSQQAELPELRLPDPKFAQPARVRARLAALRRLLMARLAARATLCAPVPQEGHGERRR
jgi:hypothetical protein